MAKSTRLWINATLPITTISNGAKAVFNLAGNAPESYDNTTVSRILGWMRSRQVFAGATFVNIWVGVTVISQQAGSVALLNGCITPMYIQSASVRLAPGVATALVPASNAC